MSETVEVEGKIYAVDQTTGELKPLEVKAEPDANLAKRQVRGSVSLIKAYKDCPAQAYGRITRQKQSKGMPLVNGIAVHEAIEKYIKEDKDPVATYEKVLRNEAERNDVSLLGEDADDAKKIGLECVGAAVSILGYKGMTDVPLKDRLDHSLVEAPFSITRNGRLYVGKIDYGIFKNPTFYSIGDWKTGKNAPKPHELNTDLQFTMYYEAAYTDTSLKTYGIWPTFGVYVHLRGQSTEFKNGRRVDKNKTKKPLQYDFPTKRTPEYVAQQFATVIEPVMDLMEEGRWYRNEGKNCEYCGFYNKAKERCEVEIPADSQFKEAAGQLSLIDHAEIVKAAPLKPYNNENSPA